MGNPAEIQYWKDYRSVPEDWNEDDAKHPGILIVMDIPYLATLYGREMGIGAIVQPRLVTDLCKKVLSGATVSKGFHKTVQDLGVSTLSLLQL